MLEMGANWIHGGRYKRHHTISLNEYFIANNSDTNMEFPVLAYPKKPSSLNLIKSHEYQGTLVGIKGQYLIFDDETVFNIRANEGLVVDISIN